MIRFKTVILILVAGVFCSGCETMIDDAKRVGLLSRTADTNGIGPGYMVPFRTVVPNGTLQLSPSYAISFENLVIGAAIYYFIDPLAPNWSGELQRLSENTFSINLRMKRFKTGGDGEGVRVFHRNAEALARSGGYPKYEVVSYTESIESEMLGTIRVAEGVIRLSNKHPGS